MASAVAATIYTVAMMLAFYLLNSWLRGER